MKRWRSRKSKRELGSTEETHRRSRGHWLTLSLSLLEVTEKFLHDNAEALERTGLDLGHANYKRSICDNADVVPLALACMAGNIDDALHQLAEAIKEEKEKNGKSTENT